MLDLPQDEHFKTEVKKDVKMADNLNQENGYDIDKTKKKKKK